MSYWSILIALVAGCLALAYPEPSLAEKRAFVVGINRYAPLPPLSTAIDDAARMSKALAELGFRVEIVSDPDRAELDQKWAAFLATLKAADIVAFHFAGHGVQVDGANYLLPRDTPAVDAGQAAILDKALDFQQIMEDIETRRPTATLYVLDACRNNPFKAVQGGKAAPAKGAKTTLGQTKGLARMESVHGAFVMYSAGPDEEALDSLPGGPKETNSVYVRRLLPLLGTVQLSLVDIAKRVQVEVEQDARSVGRQQRPAYFDGILGQYYLSQVESTQSLGPTDRIPGDNVVRLGGFATWDSNCRSRPAPRISVVSAPRYGRILMRFESFTADGTHFGNACGKSSQRGVGVYYVIDDTNRESTAVESVQLAVKHWSVAPVTTVNESYDIDLATRYGKRTTKR